VPNTFIAYPQPTQAFLASVEYRIR